MTVENSGPGAKHFDINVHWHDRDVVLSVSGELDLTTAPSLAESVSMVMDQSPAIVVIDLTDVGFLASAGMSLLASTHQKLGGSSSFAVVADGPATGRPLALVGLNEVFGIYATVDEAFVALRTDRS